jgi:phosphatidylserine decarboxylase
VDHFVGGTVYQAFLSALNYHRWHAPVAGTIVRAYLKDDTYFSEAESRVPTPTSPPSPNHIWPMSRPGR